jgi:hypothetical protein
MTTSSHINFLETNQTTEPKTLFISSIKNHKDRIQIINEIEKFFGDERNFLNTDSNIYVGRKPRGPRYDENNEIIPYSFVGNSNYLQKSTLKKSNTKKILNQSSKTTETQGQLLKKKIDTCDILDSKILQNYYTDMKNHTIRNKKKENKIMLNKIPILIREQLKNQEKNLNEFDVLDNMSKTMENYLVKKTKKNKDQLLMTNVDSYLFRKAVLNTIVGKTPKEIKLGDNNWYFDLRRPKNFIGNRDCYINIGTNDKPFWGRFFEKSPNYVLKCRKPIINENYIKTFRKNPYLPVLPNGSNVINELAIMSTLHIDGKSLIDFEKNLADYPGKKKLYKRNQLEIIEESKNLTAPELEKYIHEITCDQIYKDDYNVREMYKSLTGRTPFMSASISSTVYE